MQWQASVQFLVTLAVITAGNNTIPGIKDKDLTNVFGSPSLEETKDPCVCVPFYQCTSGGTLNEYGENVIDIRLGAECEDTLQQCCTPENITQENEKEPSEEPHYKPHHHMSSESTSGHDTNECGIRNPRGVGFEITGAMDGESNFGEFPWMVALMSNEESIHLFQYICGGSLIHGKVVLTAAHCIHQMDINSLMVRAGEWDSQSQQELYLHEQQDIDHVIAHEHFNPKDLRNDIALLVLKTPFNPAPHIGFICLPTQGQSVDHSRCLASGWGKENFGKHSQYQTILKSIELPIMPYTECLEAFHSTRLGNFFKLHSSFICAGGEKGKDLCKGDGGGPLVCPMSDEPTRYFQAGIVAWGIGCGDERVPGAYASVAQFRDWIDEKMMADGFGMDTYTKTGQHMTVN